MKDISTLQKVRYQYVPKLPKEITTEVTNIAVKLGDPTQSVDNQAKVKEMFPNTYGKPIAKFVSGKNSNATKEINVGVILSGGQAPGGHNVIAGLFDGIKKANQKSKLFGFLGGPSGIVEDKKIEITKDLIDDYRNTGGFDIIGSGRTKLESEEQFDKAIEVCKKNGITAVVIIGGDDSNTNAALMAEYFMKEKCGIQIIGCPKTIDGDLKNQHIETSFGFDTATKVYSELIGNIERDANSAKKYWHFIKLMGRSASHIALECALQTQPNITIISEEVEQKKQTLNEIVSYIANIISDRGNRGDNFGVVLIPEGLIEFVPEMKKLISELNDIMSHYESEFANLKTIDEQSNWLKSKLSSDSKSAFLSLPVDIQKQLLMDRDPHGNVQVSRIETDKLLIDMVGSKLEEMKKSGLYKGKYSGLNHFFGYEGRCSAPSNFDADYCYSLGMIAFLLIANGLTGYMSSVSNLSQPSEKWVAGGIPITMMFNMEQRHGSQKPVIKKALVDLDGKPFKFFVSQREIWAKETLFVFPGSIQYYGPSEVCDAPTKTLILEHK